MADSFSLWKFIQIKPCTIEMSREDSIYPSRQDERKNEKIEWFETSDPSFMLMTGEKQS